MAAKLAGLLSQLKYTAWSVVHPESLRPTYSVSTFDDLRVPESIKLVILDKDNCFAQPHELTVWPAFRKRWAALVAGSPKQYDLAVLSNTAGYAAKDNDDALAHELEAAIGVKVLRHTEPKPMCYEELLKTLPCKPSEVLVVGDRLLTDILTANLMGARSVWIRPGIHPTWLNHLETRLWG